MDLLFLSLADRRAQGRPLAAGYCYEHGVLRVALAEAGYRSEQLQAYALTSLRWLSEHVRGRAPSAVFLDGGLARTDLDLFDAVGRAVRRGRAGGHVLATGVPTAQHAAWLRAVPWVDGVLAPGGHAEIARLARWLTAGSPPGEGGDAWRWLSWRGRDGAGGGEEVPEPSPYRAMTIPTSAAGEAGVRFSPGDLARGAAELAWIDERSSRDLVVPLHGAQVGRDELGDALAPLELARCRVAVDVDVLGCDVGRAEELAGGPVAACTLVVEDPGQPWQRPVAAWWGRLEELGITPQLRVEVGGPVEADVTALAAEARSVSPAALVRSRTEPLRVDRTLAAPAPGDTVDRLERTVEGRYAGVLPYCEFALDAVWEAEQATPEEREWLETALGMAGAVFDLSAAGQMRSPVLESHRLERWRERGGAGWRLDGHTPLTVAGYAAGRERDLAGRAVLTLERPEDVEAFLADADRAHEAGQLSASFLRPLSTLLDVAVWAGPRQDASPTCVRLWVTPDRQVRPAPAARPLGEVGEPFDTLRARALRAEDEMERRAPEGAWASLAVPEWLPEAEFFAACGRRPWLPQYVALPRLVRRLLRWHPDLSGGRGLAKLRLSGFGALVAYGGPVAPAAPGAVLLAQVDDRWHYLFNAEDDHAVRVTPDMATLFEGLVWAPDPEALQRWLVESRGLRPEQAGTAISTATEQLHRFGMLAPR